MKVIDIILALVFGRIIGFLVGDFLRGWGIHINLYWNLVIWLLFPLFSLFCLWLAYLIGKKFLFVFQGAKHLLVGAVATVIDLKVFEFLFWALSNSLSLNGFLSLSAKTISFFVATFSKFWGNKYWSFQKHEKENMKKEIIQFFVVTLAGLAIDVALFYYFTKIMGAQFGVPNNIWIKFSVIFAGLASAAWNFIGYKFFVFKK